MEPAIQAWPLWMRHNFQPTAAFASTRLDSAPITIIPYQIVVSRVKAPMEGRYLAVVGTNLISVEAGSAGRSPARPLSRARILPAVCHPAIPGRDSFQEEFKHPL